MDKRRWSLTFHPRPTEDSFERLAQAVRLIITSSQRTSTVSESPVSLVEADGPSEDADVAPEGRAT
jgi:hypothetical protein